jgi:hypothetical protein
MVENSVKSFHPTIAKSVCAAGLEVVRDCGSTACNLGTVKSRLNRARTFASIIAPHLE